MLFHLFKNSRSYINPRIIHNNSNIFFPDIGSYLLSHTKFLTWTSHLFVFISLFYYPISINNFNLHSLKRFKVFIGSLFHLSTTIESYVYPDNEPFESSYPFREIRDITASETDADEQLKRSIQRGDK